MLRVWLAETTEQRISHYEADRHANPQLPSANAPTSRFGSWSNALVAAGYPPSRHRRHWTRDAVLAALAPWLHDNRPARRRVYATIVEMQPRRGDC